MLKIESKQKVKLKNKLIGEVFLMQDDSSIFLLHSGDFGFTGPFHIEEVEEILEEPKTERKGGLKEIFKVLKSWEEQKC